MTFWNSTAFENHFLQAQIYIILLDFFSIADYVCKILESSNTQESALPSKFEVSKACFRITMSQDNSFKKPGVSQ